MKKLIIVLILLLMISGCGKKSDESVNVTKDQIKEYKEIVKYLDNENNLPVDTKDFKAKVVYSEREEGGYDYNLIISDPAVKMYDITLIATTLSGMDQYFPSLGIFDSDTYSLYPGKVEKDEGYYKGIALSGTTKNKDTVRCYISYYNSEYKDSAVHYVFEVKP